MNQQQQQQQQEPDDETDSDSSGIPDFRNPPFNHNRLPETVQKFLTKFCEIIQSGVVSDIQQIYEETFPQIVEHYFNKFDWPDAHDVGEVIKNKIFLILYKELYYGQMGQCSVAGPTLEMRIASFLNYCDFFNTIISTKNPIVLDLPELWIWELLDEFIYQFQNHMQYRSRLIDKDEVEINKLCMEHHSVWSILCVLNVLHTLIEISKIHKQMQAVTDEEDPRLIAGKFGKMPLYKILGYYAIIGLSRLHCMLGDYYLAIKVFEPVLAAKKMFDAQLPACQIIAIYNVSFAFMMTRRYSDAIGVLTDILLSVQRDRHQLSARSYQTIRIDNIIERMYHLLALCLVMHSQSINEAMLKELFDTRYQEGIAQLQAGNMDTFRQYFLAARQDFINACPPAINAPIVDFNKVPLEQQMDIFIYEVENVLQIKDIKLMLKPFNTVPLQNLFPSCGLPRAVMESEATLLLARLLSFKYMHISNDLIIKKADDLDGIFERDSEMDFYIDGEMIHVVKTCVAQRYGEYFFRKILQLRDLNKKLQNIHI